MPTNYNAKDLTFSFLGDYTLGPDGDLGDTVKDQIISLIQEIQTISNSDFLDWRDFPQYAAGLNDFVGEPNNRDTSKKISERLRTALISNNIVKADDLSIKVIPVGRSEVMIVISVNAASTPENSLSNNLPAKVVLIYNYVEQGIFFIEGNQFNESGNA